MTFREILAGRKQNILQRWFEIILDTYPADAAQFLNNQKDRFANPVGATISEGMGRILFELFQEKVDQDRISPHLDSIVRIRAVQQYTPSQALGFILLLKKVVREVLGKDGLLQGQSDALAELDSDIDSLTLLAFNLYMHCREKLYEIRANEVKRSTHNLLRMARLITEEEESAPDAHVTDFIKLQGKEAAQ